MFSRLTLTPPPPALQVVEHDLVAPTRGDDLPVVPAQRPLRPPPILDQPRLADESTSRLSTTSGRRRRAASTATRRGTDRRRGPVTAAPRARSGSRLERGQDRPPLWEARVGVDLEHAQRSIGSRRGTRLSDRFAQACRSRRGRVVEQNALVTGRRTESLDREPERLRREQASAPAAAPGASRIRAGSESASRNTTCSRHVPPCSTSSAEMTTARSVRPRRSRRASSRSISSSRPRWS